MDEQLRQEVERAVADAKEAWKKNDHAGACVRLARLRERIDVKSEPLFCEVLDVTRAISTYKDPSRGALRRFTDAGKLLEPWAKSSDPETLSISGSVEKRVWQVGLRAERLARGAELYGKGHREQ